MAYLIYSGCKPWPQQKPLNIPTIPSELSKALLVVLRMKNQSNSVAATKATFLLLSAVTIFVACAFAVSSFYFDLRGLLFVSIVSICPLIYFMFKFLRSSTKNESAKPAENRSAKDVFTADVEEKLLAFEQIGEYFGSSLKPADMFRLIGNRIGEIIPFDGCFLFLDSNTSDKTLKLAQVISEEPSYFSGLVVGADEGILGKAYGAKRSASDADLSFREKLFPQHFNASIASPINDREGNVLGVLALSSKTPGAYDKSSLLLLQAVVERVSTLINSSFNNQRNATTALTNVLTGLPNEAAFYLILEQQIAEAQRFSQKHALTVLCIDVRDFNKINQDHGHATGDQVLTYVAKTIKDQLRQMDFLSHPSGDEFWAILPGATSNIVELVIERMDRAFSKSIFTSTENVSIELEMNFGTATFKKDGETAMEMTQTALRRKALDKNPAAGEMQPVIPFPLRNQQMGEHPY